MHTKNLNLYKKSEWIDEITLFLEYATNYEYVVGRDKNLEKSMLLTYNNYLTKNVLNIFCNGIKLV